MIKHLLKYNFLKPLFQYRALLCFVLPFFLYPAFSQQIPEFEKSFYIDSAGNVFMNKKMPVYLFLVNDQDAETKHLLPSYSKHANPMYFDRHGQHLITHVDPATGEKAGYKIFADGLPPESKLHIKNGLILHFENRFYCEKSVEIEITAEDTDAGVKNSFYSINGNEYKLYNNPLIIEHADFEQVTFFSVDNVGNVEDPVEAYFIFSIDDVIELENIYFAYDCAQLNKDARKQLDELALSLKKFPELRIELRSHTDARGSARYNQRLSERRAASTRNYLITKGISPDRLIAIGFGSSKIINHCIEGIECTEEEHQKNRRTEFRFIPFDEN